MMRRTTSSTQIRVLPLLCAALLAFVAGCATDEAPMEEAPVQETRSEFEDASSTTPTPPETNLRDTRASAANLTISPVYFDLDQSTVKDEFASILRTAADALRESGASVTIEGHCDERGSEEYNIALGERRANAVRSYLYNLGVPNGQMTVVSYGEARPAVNGSGETAYQLNRRAQFRLR